MNIAQKLIRNDYAACLALSDAHKAENAALRAECLADGELNALLLAEAQRRGQASIDWPEYFRNIRIN